MGRRLILLCGVLALATPGFAAARQPAFPPSFETARVAAADACWRDCQSACTWDLRRCVRATPQGVCLKFTDRCDRACQISCRLGGGPLVPIE